MGANVTRSQPPLTQKHVDLEKYQGKWYGIAKYPFAFEPEKMKNIMATYTLTEDKKSMRILNCSFLGDGKKICAKGIAQPTDSTNSMLVVKFDHQDHLGHYWILETDPECKEYALVGHPFREQLWILSRTKVMPSYDYGVLLNKLNKIYGYDTRMLVMTKQEL